MGVSCILGNQYIIGSNLSRPVIRGAPPGTVGTVSTVPDFFDQDELFYHFIQNMKMSFVFHIKFQIQ